MSVYYSLVCCYTATCPTVAVYIWRAILSLSRQTLHKRVALDKIKFVCEFGFNIRFPFVDTIRFWTLIFPVEDNEAGRERETTVCFWILLTSGWVYIVHAVHDDGSTVRPARKNVLSEVQIFNSIICQTVCRTGSTDKMTLFWWVWQFVFTQRLFVIIQPAPARRPPPQYEPTHVSDETWILPMSFVEA